ncbi:hypothetical protein GTA28_29010 [Rhodococcus hoagii]|nr:hypothetical protein [Prescottella equi]
MLTPDPRFTAIVDFGTIAVPHLADSRISIVARDGYVDTVTIRIRDVQVAVNLYAAESDGTVPGYVGSCLRYLSSQNVSPSTIISPSVGEIGGTTPGGTHIRFLTRTGHGGCSAAR